MMDKMFGEKQGFEIANSAIKTLFIIDENGARFVSVGDEKLHAPKAKVKRNRRRVLGVHIPRKDYRS